VRESTSGYRRTMSRDEEPAPTGMPDEDAPEPPPRGPAGDMEDAPATGPAAMPGIPTEGEPPDAG
jgi:hypothetical protein